MNNIYESFPIYDCKKCWSCEPVDKPFQSVHNRCEPLLWLRIGTEVTQTSDSEELMRSAWTATHEHKLLYDNAFQPGAQSHTFTTQ